MFAVCRASLRTGQQSVRDNKTTKSKTHTFPGDPENIIIFVSYPYVMKGKEIFTLEDAEKLVSPVSFVTMLKPAGSSCNLDCTYCYYLDKAVQYGGRNVPMPDDLLEMYIRQYIEANSADTVLFNWHGGEPLLMGKDFYRKALALQKKYADGRKIENTIQTNGTLVDEEWCDLFAENGFLVGISIDGPEDIHDAFRRTRGGGPTFRKVMDAVSMFRSAGVEFNTLSVVNSLCENRGGEVYRFLRDKVKSAYMQFLPAVEHIVDRPDYHRPVIVSPETEGASLAPWSVSAAGYGKFLCDIFDEWVIRDVGRVFVQMFDATLAQWCGVRPGVCSMCETCGDALVVERNGDVYPCDHFVYPEYLLGNIRQTHIKDIYMSRERLQFGLDKRNSLPVECLRCRFYFACRGECPKHRFAVGSDGCRKNSLCEGLYAYFCHSEPYMEYMKSLLLRKQAPSLVIPYARHLMGIRF